jgi:hypothetical protein
MTGREAAQKITRTAGDERSGVAHSRAGVAVIPSAPTVRSGPGSNAAARSLDRVISEAGYGRRASEMFSRS